MSTEHVIYNKKKLCSTDVSDFTDFQGVGSDPLYKRYESVSAVMRTSISDAYKGFLAQPVYNADDDTIDWYADEWTEQPRILTTLTGAEWEKYQLIKDKTVRHFHDAVLKLSDEDLIILGGVLRFIPEDAIFCFDNKVVLVTWGMRYDDNKHQDFGSLMHDLPTKPENPKPNEPSTEQEEIEEEVKVEKEENKEGEEKEGVKEEKEVKPEENKKEKKKNRFAAIWRWLWKILLALLLLFLLALLLRYCKNRPVPPKPSHGDVEITLQWKDRNDLDLHCVEPSGDTINFTNLISRSGGQLEIDMNAGIVTNRPIEHIYWPDGQAPAGTYTVIVNYYSRRTSLQDSSPFTVKVKYGDHTETYSGSLTEHQNATVCQFTYDPEQRQQQ